MTEHEEIIIYDTMVQMQELAPILCQILNERSTPAERDAYKRVIYAAVVRLGSLFTTEQRAAHEARHRKTKEECDAFFAAKANSNHSSLSWESQNHHEHEPTNKSRSGGNRPNNGQPGGCP